MEVVLHGLENGTTAAACLAPDLVRTRDEYLSRIQQQHQIRNRCNTPVNRLEYQSLAILNTRHEQCDSLAYVHTCFVQFPVLERQSWKRDLIAVCHRCIFKGNNILPERHGKSHLLRLDA